MPTTQADKQERAYQAVIAFYRLHGRAPNYQECLAISEALNGE